MDLWIRSQDKEILMKIDNINLGLDVDSNEPCRLFTFVDGAVTSFTLGIYRSKERALEVLDEIKNILMPKIIINFKHKPIYKNDLENNLVFVHDSLVPYEGYEDKKLLTYVYEMPKE